MFKFFFVSFFCSLFIFLLIPFSPSSTFASDFILEKVSPKQLEQMKEQIRIIVADEYETYLKKIIEEKPRILLQILPQLNEVAKAKILLGLTGQPSQPPFLSHSDGQRIKKELPSINLGNLQGRPSAMDEIDFLWDVYLNGYTPKSGPNAGQRDPDYYFHDAITFDDPSLVFVTIDNDDSEDLDQAMAIIRAGNNGKEYHLYYAIADTTFAIKNNRYLDAEAMLRGQTTYTPFEVFPMLPRELSGGANNRERNGLLSLYPQVWRRALVLKLVFDDQGHLLFDRSQIIKGKIKSQHKLSYNGVQRYYDRQREERASKGIKEAGNTTVDLLRELGEKLLVLARERGQIKFITTELKYDYDAQAGHLRYYQRAPLAVELYNEQVSIMANHFVASWVKEQKLPSIHRYHAQPEYDSFTKMKDILTSFSGGHPLVADMDVENPHTLHALLEELKASEISPIINDTILRGMAKARYSSDQKNNYHYGIALKSYDFFTAPMRRYPDFVLHRLVNEGKKNADVSYSHLANLFNAAEERETRILRRIDLYLQALAFAQMQRKAPDRIYSALVTRLNPRGDSVTLRIQGTPFTMDLTLPQLGIGGAEAGSGVIDYEHASIKIGHNNSAMAIGNNKGQNNDKEIKLGQILNFSLRSVHPEALLNNLRGAEITKVYDFNIFW